MYRIFLILLLVLLLPVNSNSQDEQMNKVTRYGVMLSADKSIYQLDESITKELKVFNQSNELIQFQFTSSQRYDFLIKDMKSNLIWRWSEDKMFAMLLGEERLDINQPQLIYQENYNIKLEPGYYRVKGLFTAKNYPISAEIVIQVK